MKDDVKKDWICALRSGEYTQGKYVLKQRHRNDQIKHCCLGVLVELYIEKKGDEAEVEWRESKSKIFRAVNKNMTQKDYLPEEVTKWAGLEAQNPTVQIDESETCLSSLNDGDGLPFDRFSFDEIADAIEQSL